VTFARDARSEAALKTLADDIRRETGVSVLAVAMTVSTLRVLRAQCTRTGMQCCDTWARPSFLSIPPAPQCAQLTVNSVEMANSADYYYIGKDPVPARFVLSKF
jgi:hypothetical protein